MDSILITLCAVLFNVSGFAETVTFHIERNVVVNCSKCLTFWTVLTYGVVSTDFSVRTLAVAFGCSYMALWLELGFSCLNSLYNRLYGKIYSGETESGKEH